MLKAIKFFIIKITYILLKKIVSLITIRNKQIIIMGLRAPITKWNNSSKDYFMHNTKYMFLKLSKQNTDYKFVYLCDNENMQAELLKRGFKNIFTRKSLKGIYYALRAKYWLYDDSKIDIINPLLSGGAICINFWHGTSWKRIGFTANENHMKRNKIFQKIEKLLYDKDSYMIANNDYEVNIYTNGYLLDIEHTPILCSPRLDVLFNDIPDSTIFMEEDFSKIKYFKSCGKKIFIYMPTFRDTGKDISGWIKSNKLRTFLKNNNSVLICKLHFADKNAISLEQTDEIYKMNGISDMYPILKYTDALITDYSSIALDYLLVNKPIIYFPIDLEEYQEKCRGFFVPYDEFVAGDKVYSEDELINSMQKIINEEDNYKECRKELRDKMFKYQDGKNCERFFNFIKELNNKR